MKGRQPILPAIPLLLPAAMLIAGIVAACVLGQYTLYGAAAMAALVFAGLLMRRPMTSLLAGFACLGMLSIALRSYPSAQISGREQAYAGVVEEVWRTERSQRAVVRLLSPAADRGSRVYLRVHAGMPLMLEGDTARFRAVLRGVEGAPSPVPHDYSPRRQMWRYGVSATADIFPEFFAGRKGQLQVSEPAKEPIGRRMYGMRQRLIDGIYDSGVNGPTAAFLSAVLTGDSTWLDDDTRESFSAAGVAHTLALSGTHVAVVAMLLSLLFFPLSIAGKRSWSTLLIVVALWGYALLTGLSPSVTRAVIMATVLSAARLLRRDRSALNSLCLAAILILLVKPRELFFPGFQLSFVTVAAIVMFSYFLVPGWKMPSVIRWAWIWCAVCLSAVIGTSALVAWHFHQLPLYFLLSNVPAALLLPVMMTGEAMLLVAGLFGAHMAWLAEALNGCYGALTWCVERVAGAEGANIGGFYFPWWLLIAFYGGLAALWIAIRRRSAAWAISGAMLTVFFYLAVIVAEPPVPEAEAFAIDDEYATVAVVREGGEARILTDAPPTQYEHVKMTVEARLARYAGSRRAAFGAVNEPLHGRYIDVDSARWRIGPMTIAPVGLSKELRPISEKPRYALISVRYFGTMEKVKTVLDPDTIVLSPALSEKMHRRFAEQLDTLNIPYRTGLPPVLLPMQSR